MPITKYKCNTLLRVGRLAGFRRGVAVRIRYGRSHAHLKGEQGIRGTSDEHIAEAIDAIGDIVVFLAGYCNSNGYDLSECVTKAWEEVKNRDWSNKGRTPEKADKNFNDLTTRKG